jgi:hypothetical protein
MAHTFRMVPDTPYPNAVAPENSIIPPRIHAQNSGRAPDPTVVPQELAASLAPAPQQPIRVINPEKTPDSLQFPLLRLHPLPRVLNSHL